MTTGGWFYPKRKGRTMESMKQALLEAGLAPPRLTTSAADIDLTKYLAGGGRCVVLGGRTTNFTDVMRKHAQFIFWDSTDPKSRGRELPSNARALLITRFNDHVWEGRIRRSARDRGVFCPPGFISTGDVRDIIQRFLDSPASKIAVPTNGHETEPTAVVHVEPAALAAIENVTVAATPVATEQVEQVPTLDMSKRNWLVDFVAAYADLDARPQIAEARRVLAALKKAGGKSTDTSVYQAMYQLRMAAGKRILKRADKTIRNAGIMTPAAAAPVATAAPVAPRRPPKVDGFDGELAAAMAMAVDAMKRLEDAREAMSLAIDALKQLQNEDNVRRERIAKIRAALGE